MHSAVGELWWGREGPLRDRRVSVLGRAGLSQGFAIAARLQPCCWWSVPLLVSGSVPCHGCTALLWRVERRGGRRRRKHSAGHPGHQSCQGSTWGLVEPGPCTWRPAVSEGHRAAPRGQWNPGQEACLGRGKPWGAAFRLVAWLCPSSAQVPEPFVQHLLVTAAGGS